MVNMAVNLSPDISKGAFSLQIRDHWSPQSHDAHNIGSLGKVISQYVQRIL